MNSDEIGVATHNDDGDRLRNWPCGLGSNLLVVRSMVIVSSLVDLKVVM